VQGSSIIHNLPWKRISLNVVRVKVALSVVGVSMLLVIISVGSVVRSFVARAFVGRCFYGSRRFIVRLIFSSPTPLPRVGRGLRTVSFHLECLIENSLPFRKAV
jgi:hypothetical protein